MKMNKLFTTLAAATLAVATAGTVVFAETNVEDAKLPVKIDAKTGVISSNGPVDVPTAGEKGEVTPVGESAEQGKGESNIEIKGDAKLDKDGNLESVTAKGPANVQEALPEFKGEVPGTEKKDEKKEDKKEDKKDEKKTEEQAKKTEDKATSKAPVRKLPATSAVK